MLKKFSLGFIILMIIFGSNFVYSRSNENILMEDSNRNYQWFDLGCVSGNPVDPCEIGKLARVYGECLDNSHCSEGYCQPQGECNEYSCVGCLDNSHCSGSICTPCGYCTGGGNIFDCEELGWPNWCLMAQQIPLSPFLGVERIKGDFKVEGYALIIGDKFIFKEIYNFFNYWINKKSNTDYLLSNLLFSSRIVKTKGKLTLNNEATYDCVSDEACATCVDGFSNDYAVSFDCDSSGCNYDQCDDSRESRSNRDNSCVNYFGVSGSISTLNALCEGDTLPSGEIFYSGEGICLPEEGYFGIFSSYPGYEGYFSYGAPSKESMNSGLCEFNDRSCCVDSSTSAWQSSGELIPNNNGDTLNYFTYVGDGYCQGWRDSGNNVCESNDNNCFPDPEWDYCDLNPDGCTWGGEKIDIREDYGSTLWIDSNGITHSDCPYGCIKDMNSNGFSDTFDCDSTFQLSDCTISSDCTNGYPISGLTVSSVTGGHITTGPSYDFNICCDSSFNIGPSGTYELFSLSSASNAHFGAFENSNYYNYFISGGGISSCEIVGYNSCNSPDNFCIFSVSGTDNAHIADCVQEGYGSKLCCNN